MKIRKKLNNGKKEAISRILKSGYFVDFGEEILDSFFNSQQEYML